MASILDRRKRNYDRALVRAFNVTHEQPGAKMTAATTRRLRGGIPGTKGLSIDPGNIPPEIYQKALQRIRAGEGQQQHIQPGQLPTAIGGQRQGELAQAMARRRRSKPVPDPFRGVRKQVY